MDSTIDDRWEPPDRREEETFIATITAESGGRTCTISPVPGESQAVRSEWISAEEGSFLALEEIQ